MLIQRTRRDKPPALVAVSWRRIEAWLDEHLPLLKISLRPGISKEDLAKFEKLVGRRLPDDVRESWLIHDGQRPIPRDLVNEPGGVGPIPRHVGLIFGQRLIPLIGKEGVNVPAVEEWKSWDELIGQAERREDHGMLAEFGETCTSSPEGAIHRLYASRAWIPLVWIGESNNIGVDLDPGPNGVVGQVINFGRDEEEKYVLAASWAHFLEDYADELEAGNFVIDLKSEFGDFDMKEPLAGGIYQNFKQWSQAKVAAYLGKHA